MLNLHSILNAITDSSSCCNLSLSRVQEIEEHVSSGFVVYHDFSGIHTKFREKDGYTSSIDKFMITIQVRAVSRWRARCDAASCASTRFRRVWQAGNQQGAVHTNATGYGCYFVNAMDE